MKLTSTPPLTTIVAFLILLSILLACANSNSSRTGESPGSRSAPATPAITVTASELYAAYEANEVAADDAYKSKLLRVTGRVDSIGKDILDSMYVTLSSGKQYSIMNVQCMFEDQHKAELSRLGKGQQVTVVGVCDGKFGNVILKDCRLE